jgi:ketosteroid isomerase-like protein
MQALAQFYRALNSRNLSLMQQNWANSAESAMDNPLGGIKRGWDEIKSVYEKLFGSGSAYRFEFYDYTVHETADLFYVVGRERGDLALSGQPLRLAIRTTRLFRRDSNSKWRQVHHHGSIDDPRMLAAYQEAVFGTR